MRYLFLTVLVLVLPVTVRAETNVALNKSYTFSHAPNYPYCTDEGDATDLTDGLFHDPKGTSLWTQKGAVGWAIGEQLKTIDMDLEAKFDLSRVTFQTAADARTQGTFPLSVMVFTSDDGKSYRYAGELINEAVDQSTYVVHTYKLSGIRASGRFVRLVMVRGGFYVFCREVEIFGKESESPVSSQGMTRDGTLDFARKRLPLLRQFNSSLVLLGEALNRVTREEADHSLAARAAREKLVVLREELNRRTTSEKVDFRRGVPFTSLDYQVCQVIGELLQKTGVPPLSISPANPWKHHVPFPHQESPPPLERLKTMKGEWAELAFNVINAGTESMQLNVTVSGIPEGSVALQQVIFVEAFGFRTRADALMPIAGTITLTPGMTSQIWLTIDTRKMAAGQYRGTFTLEGSGNEVSSPVQFDVSEIGFPKETALDINAFGYMHWPVPRSDPEGTARNMHEHYINNHVIVSSYLPHPRVNANGDSIGPMDFSMLDDYMATIPEAKRWTMFLGFEWDYRKMYPREGEPRRKKIFQQWLREVIAHMKKKGLGYDEFNFLWVDEPSQERIAEVVAPSTRALREVDPKAQVWIDITGDNTEESISRYPDLADLWCPASEKVHWDFWKGKKYWHYDSSSDKSKSPTAHYRHKLWQAFQVGASGNAFWCYTDDADPWDDYAGTPSYGVVYDNAEGKIISSKRLEAYRAGIEDYQLCWMLRSAVKAARKEGLSEHPDVQTAEKKLNDYLSRLKELRHDDSWAERAHVELLEMLEAITRLRKQQG